MNAVGRLGSYISRSVTTVSGPFHPFGGAVDIIVVKQRDGSFKSSPWYVRFGKFQGVLKSKEKVVSINVNGVDVDFNMYLDHRGEAYFLREVEAEEGDSLFSPPSSEEDTDGQLLNRGPLKSKSWNSSADFPDTVTQIDVSNGNVVPRTNSKRSRILGFVFGRKSIKGKKFSESENSTGVVRAESLERAEIAADLLEVNWSTNFASCSPKKDNPSRSSTQDVSKDETSKDLRKNDGQSNGDSCMDRNITDNLDGCKTCEEPSPAGARKNHTSPSSLLKLDNTVEETTLEDSCSVSEYLVETVTISGSTNGCILDKPVTTEKSGLVSEDNFENAVNTISDIPDTNLQASDTLALKPCPDNFVEKEQVLDAKHPCLSDGSLNKEEDGAGKNQSLTCHEISQSQMMASDDSCKQTNRISCLSCGKFREVHSEMLHLTTDSPEVTLQPENETSRGNFKVQEFLIENNHILIEGIKGLESEITSSNSDRDDSVTKSSPQVVTFQSSFHERVESHSVSTMSTACTSISGVQKSISFRKQVGDTQKPGGDSALLNILGSEISEEEQLLFGDLEEFTINELKNLEFVSQKEEEADLWLSPRESEGANEPALPKYETSSSRDRSLEDTQSYVDNGRRRLRTTSCDIHIPIDNKFQTEECTRIVRSLPDMRSLGNRIANDIGYPLDHSLDRADDDGQSTLAQQTTQDSKIIDKLEVTQTHPPGNNPTKSIDASSGSWKIWPFPSKRSGSIVSDSSLNCNGSPDAENIMKSPTGEDEPKDVPKINVVKKKIITLTPTSEQLATLNLKEGKNIVTFTFSTPMLGKQQVDACIYLWRWDTRIVISDVDGTITRSDVLGQFMPLVGVDWSQTGVAHLFSAIKENGYQLIFLSARAISQAYHTRQFLFNLKQDGKTLPDGPVVISPDGLFPSLFREVVRRAPHEFKIACLEEIKALFPSDMNPFYAGFGNRDTDEFSYLKVGIPKGKIFIINPKGQIVVNRHIDTKSYTSIHTLVNGMFPPTSLSDEQEDFNTWNFWKLPPPAINI